MIDILGRSTSPDGLQFYEGNDSLHTTVQVLRLAEELGISVVNAKNGGVYWISFERGGKPLSKISFYKASYAYAFLLGVAAHERS
jgi:hypothetical protein